MGLGFSLKEILEVLILSLVIGHSDFVYPLVSFGSCIFFRNLSISCNLCNLLAHTCSQYFLIFFFKFHSYFPLLCLILVMGAFFFFFSDSPVKVLLILLIFSKEPPFGFIYFLYCYSIFYRFLLSSLHFLPSSCFRFILLFFLHCLMMEG